MAHGPCCWKRRADGGSLPLSESVYNIPAKYAAGPRSGVIPVVRGWTLWLSTSGPTSTPESGEGMGQGPAAHQVTWDGEGSTPKARALLSAEPLRDVELSSEGQVATGVPRSTA